MGRLSSSVMSQMVVVGLVVGAVPYATPRPDPVPDATSHRTLLTATPSTADLAAEERYLALAEQGHEAAEAAATVEEAAVALADSLAAIPVSGVEGAASCPTPKLSVSWDEPGPEYVHGALVTPLGPAPGPEDEEVNGVVLCEGYPYAFMGFEARRADGGWDVVAVPFLGSDHGHESANDDADHHDHDGHDDHDGRDRSGESQIKLPTGDLGPIEGYAKYEPQRICHASVKPGTDGLKRLLLGRYPMTRNLGIIRGCSIGGKSEHKEGRAFDWGAYAGRSAELAAVEEMLDRLLATDEAGNRHALARRMGVMYIIWNQRIWSAYRYEAGWRPYSGRSPHTDHVHISLSWDGAMGRTSFWNANGVEAMLAAPAGAAQLTASAPGDSSGSRSSSGSGDTAAESDRRAQQEDTSRQWSRAEREAYRQARRDARREELARRLEEWIASQRESYESGSDEWTDEQREEYEARLEEWRAAQERLAQEREQAEETTTEWSEAQREAYERRLAEWRAAQEQAREARDRREAAREAERERHREIREQRDADRAAQRAEWQAERERRQQAREQRDADRRARWEAERERRQQAREQRETDRRARSETERERRQQAHEEREAHKQAERERREQAHDEREARKQAERERRQQAHEERDARRQEERGRRGGRGRGRGRGR